MTAAIQYGKGTTVLTKVFANSDFAYKLNNLTVYAGADNSLNNEIKSKSTTNYRYADPMPFGTNDSDKDDYTRSNGIDTTVVNIARYGV